MSDQTPHIPAGKSASKAPPAAQDSLPSGPHFSPPAATTGMSNQVSSPAHAMSPQLRVVSAPKEPPAGKTVKATVCLDVGTHARVSAAAALAGMDKSAWMGRAITEALKGIVVIDRRKTAGRADLSGDEDRPEPE